MSVVGRELLGRTASARHACAPGRGGGCDGVELLGDDDLVARFGGGVTCAFDVLYRRHLGEVVAFCRARLRDAELAQDAAQEVFARVLVGLPGYEPRGRFQQWLRRITRHVCIDVAERRPARVEVGLVAAGDAVVDLAAEEAVAAVGLREDVVALLRQLRPPDAALLLAHDGYGLTFAELAELFGTTRGTLAVSAHRARVRLREQSVRDVPSVVVLSGQRLAAWLQQRLSSLAPFGTDACAAGTSALIACVLALAVPPIMPGRSPVDRMEAEVARTVHHAPRAAAFEDTGAARPSPAAVRPVSGSAHGVPAAPTAVPSGAATSSTGVAVDAAPPRSPTTGPAPVASADPPAPSPYFDFDPVPVPGTDREIRADDQSEPEYQYSVNSGHGDVDQHIGYSVGFDDEESLEPVNQRACPVADALDGPVSCSGGKGGGGTG